MDTYLAAAAALAFVVGLVHSVFGEWLIFGRLRGSGWIPSAGGKLLGEGHVRILWASWHTLTALGWGMAAVLFRLASHPAERAACGVIEEAIAAAMAVGGVLVFVGTRARHPGWIGLLGVAALVLASLAA